MKRYEIIMDGGRTDREFDSFGEAVRYALANRWSVYDRLGRRVRYDGYNDELCVYNDEVVKGFE